MFDWFLQGLLSVNTNKIGMLRKAKHQPWLYVVIKMFSVQKHISTTKHANLKACKCAWGLGIRPERKPPLSLQQSELLITKHHLSLRAWKGRGSNSSIRKKGCSRGQSCHNMSVFPFLTVPLPSCGFTWYLQRKELIEVHWCDNRWLLLCSSSHSGFIMWGFWSARVKHIKEGGEDRRGCGF